MLRTTDPTENDRSMWFSGGAVTAAAETSAPGGTILPIWRRQVRGGWLAGVACLLAGLYALGALLPFWYLNAPEAGAAFFPPAGITVATLALTPRRTWPLWLAVIAATEL